LTWLLTASVDAHDHFDVLRSAAGEDYPDNSQWRCMRTGDLVGDAPDGVDG
jgi:hypothetical protein